MIKQYLLASDFDQTLSFNDSGVVLSELIGFDAFHDKVAGLSQMNLVQQGAELSYLILHDPDFRRVRREHLIETGKRIRLKHDVALFARALDNLAEGYKFNFYVISAAPQEIIQSALEGIVPRDHIFGTRFRYNEATGEVDFDHSRIRWLGQNHRARRASRSSSASATIRSFIWAMAAPTFR